MARIPLEDDFTDVLGKAQRGRKISDHALAGPGARDAGRAGAVKAGEANDDVLRRLSRPLRLGPNALTALAHRAWYPEQPDFPRGFLMFNTKFEDMRVNSYWSGTARPSSPRRSTPAPPARRCSTRSGPPG